MTILLLTLVMEILIQGNEINMFYVRDLSGKRFYLTCNRGSDLYTISFSKQLHQLQSVSMAKALPTQACVLASKAISICTR
ncbi:hypothetical protein Tco_1404663 [Tanacetum coccineum]